MLVLLYSCTVGPFAAYILVAGLSHGNNNQTRRPLRDRLRLALAMLAHTYCQDSDVQAQDQNFEKRVSIVTSQDQNSSLETTCVGFHKPARLESVSQLVIQSNSASHTDKGTNLSVEDVRSSVCRQHCRLTRIRHKTPLSVLVIQTFAIRARFVVSIHRAITFASAGLSCLRHRNTRYCFQTCTTNYVFPFLRIKSPSFRCAILSIYRLQANRPIISCSNKIDDNAWNCSKLVKSTSQIFNRTVCKGIRY